MALNRIQKNMIDQDFVKQVDDQAAQLAQKDNEIAIVNSRVDGIDRGYGGTYATLIDLQTAFPTGDTKRYVVTADGHWYYWNGTSWADGGVFQATGLPDSLSFKASNLMNNGDFSNGTTGWAVNGGTASVSEGVYKAVGDGSLSIVGLYNAVGSRYTGQANHKIYMRTLVELDNNNAQGISIYASDGVNLAYLNESVNIIASPIANTQYEISGIINLPESLQGGSIRHFIVARYANATTANGNAISIHNTLALDLTDVFGVGNEPTTSEMDTILSEYPNKYFESVENLLSIKELAIKAVSKSELSEVVENFEVQDKSITPSKIDPEFFDRINLLDKNKKIFPEFVFSSVSRNKFNKDTVTVGYYLINGVPTPSGSNRYSDYIRVTPGSIVRGTVFITSDGGAFYDRNLNFISKISADSTTQITVPNGVYWMRINISSATNLDTLMVNEGSELLPYEPYGVGTIEGLSINNEHLYGKRLLTIGDSITWLDGNTANIDGTTTTMIGYQEQFRNVGAIVTNKGNSGATYRQYDETISDMVHGSIYDDIVTNQFDVSSYDIITLFGGTNDVGRGLNLGSLGFVDDSVFDPKTTIGALRGIIEYIRANNPTCEMYLFTPIRSNLASRPYDKMEQVSEAIVNVSKMYGIPHINMLHEGGIGKGNYQVYLYDDLHPNNLGFEMIGKRMVRFINSK